MDADRHLVEAFFGSHASEAARIVERLPLEAACAVLADAPGEAAARVLANVSPGIAAGTLAAMPPAASAGVVAHLSPGIAGAALRRLSADDRAALLAALPRRMAARVSASLAHPPGSAGSVMDPDALALPEDLTVREARVRVARAGHRALPYVYVLRRDHTLCGAISSTELLRARQESHLSSARRVDVVRLPASASRRTIVSHPAWRHLRALPVVDDGGVYLGAIALETVERLEAELESRRTQQSPLVAALRVVEIYSAGVAGLLKTLVAPLANRREAPRDGG
jgi:magnesium transporter